MQGGTHLVPARVGGLPRQIVIRIPQAAAQIGYRVNAAAQHQLLALYLMHAQEIQQAAVALAQRLEELAGQPAVEKLHAAADGARLLQFGKLPVERSDIELQRPGIDAAAVHQLLLEPQILRHGNPFHVQGFGMDAEVTRARHVAARHVVQPRRTHGRLLGDANRVRQRGIQQGAEVAVAAEAGKFVPQLRAQQERPAQRGVTAQQQVHRLAMGFDEGP